MIKFPATFEAEEKYARLVKEKKNFEDKERILLNIFDTFKKLTEEKSNKEETEQNIDVIDVTGEEAEGGSSSKIIKCPKCNYKTTMQARMNQHLKDKHKQQNIPQESGTENKNDTVTVEM